MRTARPAAGMWCPIPAAIVDDFAWLKREAEKSPFVLPADDNSKPVDAKLLTRSLARWQNTLAKKGFEPFTLHDLRRTCRTGLARLKIAPHVAERVLNHAQEKIAGTYDVHDYMDEKREALGKWADHLNGLTRQ